VQVEGAEEGVQMTPALILSVCRCCQIVFVIRDTVRNPMRFFLGKFVRKQGRS
jgi:hypothetical protein